MIKNPVIQKILVAVGIGVCALILFLPHISRLFLTHYIKKTAEHVLQMKVDISSAELRLLSGTIHINDVAVFHPTKKDETFIEADGIDVGIKLARILVGKKPSLRLKIDSPELIYATNRHGDWELKNQVPLFRRGTGEKRLPLDVERITISNGEVEYRDGRAGKTTQLDDIDLDVKRVQLPTEGDPLPAKFDLSFDIDNAAHFTMKGRADFLSPKISFKSDIKLRSLPLPPFAPYYDKRDMPVRITQGTLAMNSTATCKNNYLRAPAHMTITGLRVQPKKASILGFAANRVVDSLKTRGGRLELDVMISGDIKSPNFHITSNMSKAFAGSFTKGLTTGVKNVPDKIEDAGKGIGSKVKGLFSR